MRGVESSVSEEVGKYLLFGICEERFVTFVSQRGKSAFNLTNVFSRVDANIHLGHQGFLD